MVTSDAERSARDEDIATFMALPRAWLYGGAAIALVLCVGLSAAVMASFDILGLWLPPIVAGGVALSIAVLRRSSSGRGALWTLTGNRFGSRAPRLTNLAWVVLAMLLAAVPICFRFAAARG